MSNYQFPLPKRYEIENPFYEAAKQRKLVIQKCQECGKIWWPIGYACPYCLSIEYQWAEMSGQGKISAWMRFHHNYFPSYSCETPYNVVQIELKEGPRLISNLVIENGVEEEFLSIGTPVETIFQDITDEVTLVKFTPRKENR